MAATNLGNVAVVPKGAWSNAVAYLKNNMVGNAGNMYLAMKDVPAGTLTSDTEYWMLSATKGIDGEVTNAAMTEAIAYAQGVLQNGIDTAYSGLVAHNERLIVVETEVTPIARGGTNATTTAGARTNLEITPTNIGAAPASHNHNANDVNSGVLSPERGGTGKPSIPEALTSFGLGISTTSTPAVASTLATVDFFLLYKVGKLVVLNMHYSSAITSGLHDDGAIIPLEYRPAGIVALATNFGNNTITTRAYLNEAGVVRVRLSADVTDLIVSGSWITA